MADLLGFDPVALHEEYSLSSKFVGLFDNIYLESNIAQGRIFSSKRTGNIHNWTKTVNPGYKTWSNSLEDWLGT